MSIRRTILLGLFVAVAGILHAVEYWVPIPLPVPGLKLGLANIVNLVVIVLFGWRDALVVALLRAVLGGVLSGMFLGPTFVMSASGAMVSTMAMALSYSFFRPKLSLVGISVIGAVVHNLSQLCVAAVVVVSSGILWYSPYLVLIAVPTGIITGFSTAYFLEKFPQTAIL
ncbi:MAG: Heptaprenyl diphosphate synthase component [Firmicutes bacterium]|nr:Heptaprenyl diphosphate synthase component [Bacillota bacterium]